MSVTVRIPTPLRKLTDGADEVLVEAVTVGEMISSGKGHAVVRS